MNYKFRNRFSLLNVVVFKLVLLCVISLQPFSAYGQDTVKSKLLERQARHFLSIIESDIQLSQDTQINDYVLNLANTLAVNGDMGSEPLSYFVIADNGINAFAGPGATFFINTGIIDISETEGELASVIAHELAHFKQDHLTRLTENYEATKVPLFVAILAGIAVGGDAGIAAVLGSQAAVTESMIDHTLSYEREADAVGLQILTSSGYSPNHAINLMLRLEKHIREQGVIQSNIHNTHPVTPERISSIQQRIQQYPNVNDKQTGKNFLFAQAKTRVLYNWKPNQTYKFFEQRLNEGSDDYKLAMKYGLALSLAKDGDQIAARELLHELVGSNPLNSWIVLALAELELNSNNPEVAEAVLAQIAQSDNPDNAIVEQFTLSLSHSGKYSEATRYIRKWLPVRPHQISLLNVYAQVAAKSGNIVDGHIAQAEYYFQTGNLQRARKLLKTAQNISKDFYSTELIREKLRIVENELAWRS